MHIARDPFVLLLSIVLPFMVVLILGNSIEFNLREISAVVIDQDKTTSSRKIVETFSSSGYFKTYYSDESPEKAYEEIVKENAKAEIIIPPAFEKRFFTGQNPAIQILLDGADNSSVAAISSYLGVISSLAVTRIYQKEIGQKPLLTIKERYLFNPELNSKWFAIPGLSAVIIAIVAILLTAMTICKEWEHGSMELLMSTPVRSSELMLGKIAPYAVLGSVGFIVVYLCARLLFGVPMVGSHLILFSATLLFIINYLGIGLYISVTTKVQQIAVQKALVIGMLPTSMLSGFIFPVQYMPEVLQYLTIIFPARWYVEIARNAFLQGGSFFDLYKPFLVMFVQAVIIILSSIAKFKRSLD
jgi:ABC-2 type transport system permease protein